MSQHTRDILMCGSLLVAIILSFAHPHRNTRVVLAMVTTVAGVLLAAALMTGCVLPQAGDQELDFEFPVPGVDQEDPATGVWTGRRDYDGQKGADIQYTAGACKGLITARQRGDWYLFTTEPVPGRGYMELNVQGPCKYPYAVRILPKGKEGEGL